MARKTGVFHALVAGLHVGAVAFFLYWLGNKLQARGAHNTRFGQGQQECLCYCGASGYVEAPNHHEEHEQE